MSGQPYRYVKDVENFRNEYMDALNLRANIDDMNFQANKIYKETGALPPKSTMKDMRTTSEILMDVEKLKRNIIGEFAGLATPQMIQLVIQRVQASPLNGDGSFLIWFAQNVKELVPQLKKKYSYGIAGDANDAENMYLFLQTMFSQTKDMNSTLKSAFDRPVGSDNIGINVGDLSKLKRAYDDIVLRLTTTSPRMLYFKNAIRDQFTAMNDFLIPAGANNKSKYDEMKEIFINISTNATVGQQAAINHTGYKALVEYTDKLPSPQSLRTLLEQLDKSEKNANPDLSFKILENISSILPEVALSRHINDVAIDLINSQGITLGQPPPVTPVAGPTIGAQGNQIAIGTQATHTFANDVSAILNGIIGSVTEPVGGGNGPHPGVKNYIDRMITASDTNIESQLNNWKNICGYSANVIDGAIVALTDNYNWYYMAGAAAGSGGLGGAGPAQRMVTPMNVRHQFIALRPNANTMIGSGIGKRAGRPRGSGIVKHISERIDNTQGIKQGHTHIPFGKYIINKNRLDDDIFSFKHVKGYGVKGYPSKKISRNLSNVIKTIIGGGVPKYNELSNLSEDEKEYLHKVSSKAGIMDKLSVPTPSKDSMEQDVHQFNVMKGEILAGNDSSVLIKKFKLLLLKLSKNGSLPKRECQEIMEDLIQLGY